MALQKVPPTGVAVIFQDFDILMYACTPEKTDALVDEIFT